MIEILKRRLASAGTLALFATILIAGGVARAQCPATELASGLQLPLGITQSSQGNLIVSETGTSTPNTGRISVVDLQGERRTLLDGLPSGLNDILEPSGPAGVFLRGRTLYVAIGVGDVVIGGPVLTTQAPNPNPPSSPLFSSVLAVHFSPRVERVTEGFSLSLDDHEALANGERVTLSNGRGDKITVELIANFPNFIADPSPFFAENVRGSNPFDLIAVGNRLYVTDGGRNLVWEVDVSSGDFSVLTTFPPLANPLPFGPPLMDAVPTGIAYSEGRLLVTLFRGAPFMQGASSVESVDPATGEDSLLIHSRKTAIDVIPIRERGDTDWLVLQHATVGVFFGSGGSVLRFETPESTPTAIVAGTEEEPPFCLTRPTSMTLDEKTDTLYVTEYGGRIVAIPLAP